MESKMPAEPRLNRFLSLGPHGFHHVAYAEWGSPKNTHIVLCVHGLARNSRDFDYLASDLAADCRVVGMDVAGRGASDWLEHKEDYGFALYQSDAAALLARITAPIVDEGLSGLVRNILHSERDLKVDWVGTSMGGLIGMMLAAEPNSPIRRLVLNDIGPLVPWPALMRLKNVYSGVNARFADVSELEGYLREALAAFGPLEDEQWRHLARHNSRQTEDGGCTLAFDPGIVSGLRTSSTSGIEFGSDFMLGVDLWPVWDAVQCPTLVLRGAESDFLLESTAKEMQERNSYTQVVEFAGIGHAPWLMNDDQIRVVRDFLLAPSETLTPTSGA
jgi:pimeloyl-ACP methyl ester carboxylesterase